MTDALLTSPVVEEAKRPVASQRSAPSGTIVLTRPTGVGRGIATYTIPIEGRDEWLAAAGLLA